MILLNATFAHTRTTQISINGFVVSRRWFGNHETINAANQRLKPVLVWSMG
jgi:hypothetical protein